MLLKEPIRRDRLIFAFAITFILVDTCPYPNFPPGFIQSAFNRVQQTIISE